MRFQVTDSDGAVLFESGTVSMMRKLLAPDLYTHGIALTANGEPVGWDGTTYDQTTGESVPMRRANMSSAFSPGFGKMGTGKA